MGEKQERLAETNTKWSPTSAATTQKPLRDPLPLTSGQGRLCHWLPSGVFGTPTFPFKDVGVSLLCPEEVTRSGRARLGKRLDAL